MRKLAAVEVLEVLRMHDHSHEVKSNDVCGQGPSATNYTPAAREGHGALALSNARRANEPISDGGSAFMGRPAALPPPPPQPLTLFVELPFLHASLA